MAGFSATSAGVEGFHIIKNHPAVVAVWAGVYILATLGMLALISGIAGSAVVAQLQAMEASTASGAAPSMETIMWVLGAIGGALALAIPLASIIGAMLQAAVNRVVLAVR